MDVRSLPHFQQSFQPVLEKITRQFIAETQSILHDTMLNDYVAQIENIVVRGGKRTRPYICALAYTTNNRDDPTDIQELLVALELFHVFGLIHDDIIDQGDKRHNQTTLHCFVADKSHKEKGSAEHRGVSQAILMGDFVHAWATQLVARTCLKLPTPTTSAVWQEWHSMTQAVLAGQMLDTASATRESFAREQILQTIELKTAAYSVISPMKIGGILAHASNDFMSLAKTFGIAFGIAYQLQDDLLDILHTDLIAGKTAGRDSGQHTYVTDHIATHGTLEQQKQLKKIQNNSTPLADALRQLVIESHTDAEIQCQIDNYFAQAQSALVESSLSPNQQRPWLKLIAQLKNRDR